MATRQPNRAAQRGETAKQREVVYQVGPSGIPVGEHRDARDRFVPTGSLPDYAQQQLAGAPPGLYDANGYSYNHAGAPGDYKVGNVPAQLGYVYQVDPWGKLHSFQTDEWGTTLIPRGAPGPDYNAERLAGAPPGYYRADGVGLYRTQTYWPGESKWNNTYRGAPGGPHAGVNAPPATATPTQPLNANAAPGVRSVSAPPTQSLNPDAQRAGVMGWPGQPIGALQRLVQMHVANQSAQGVRQAPPALDALTRQMSATMTRAPTSANLGGGRSLF